MAEHARATSLVYKIFPGSCPVQGSQHFSPIATLVSDMKTTYSELLSISCIVFIHFYSAPHSMSLSAALPTTAIDTVSELTRQSATGNSK